MNTLLKQGLEQECNIIKRQTHKLLIQIRYLAEAVLGWAIMLGAAPTAAWNISNDGIYSLLGGLFVVFLFFLGAQFAQNGLEGFEEANREKTVGELFKDLPSIELKPGEQPPRIHH